MINKSDPYLGKEHTLTFFHLLPNDNMAGYKQ